RQRRHLVPVSGLVLAALLAGCAGVSGLFETPDSLMREGQELYVAKKYDEAIAKFERVIQMDPTRWMAYVYLARCYIAKSDWLSAIFNGRKAFQLAPGGEDVVPAFAEALFGGGVEALRQGKFTDAIGHFVEYIRLKPTDPQGYLNAGKAYLGTGAYGDALSSFVRGLGQGGDAAARRELIQGLLDGGTQALTKGDPRAAIGFFQESVRAAPGNLTAYLNLGKAYWQAGDRSQALGAFGRVLELSPGHGEALQFLRELGR
ncbi:MAG TPA: tetratricopeptide repeat protein, partial [Candidatus Methylomirabilis sp.]